MDNIELVYITIANAKRIVNKIDFNPNVVIEGSIYKDKIPFFNKKEEYRLLLIQKLFQNMNVFILEYYTKAAKHGNRNYVIPTHSPAYHNNRDCEYLNSDFINYEIPNEIMEKDENIIERFREWFLKNDSLLKEKPELFETRMQAEFRISTKLKQIIIENSGVIEKRNYDLNELEIKIDEILNATQKYFDDADSKKKYVINKYQKWTGLGYIKEKLNNNDTGFTDEAINNFLRKYDLKFKRPVKELLVEYYRVKYNKDLIFEGPLLTQLGFHPCMDCYSIKIEIPE